MAMNKFRIIWSLESKNNVKKINNNISKDKLISISVAPK